MKAWDERAQADEEGQDLSRYKGIFFESKAPQSYQDSSTGAHFNYRDMCARLESLRRLSYVRGPFDPISQEGSDEEEDDVAEEGVHADPMLPYQTASRQVKFMTELYTRNCVTNVCHTWTREPCRRDISTTEASPFYRAERKQSAFAAGGSRRDSQVPANKLRTQSSYKQSYAEFKLSLTKGGAGQPSISSKCVAPRQWNRSRADIAAKSYGQLNTQEGCGATRAETMKGVASAQRKESAGTKTGSEATKASPTEFAADKEDATAATTCFKIEPRKDSRLMTEQAYA